MERMRPLPVEVGTPRSTTEQAPPTPDELGARLDSARRELRSTRKDGNMRSIRAAADSLAKAEREHTGWVVEARQTLEVELESSEANRARLASELEETRQRLAVAEAGAEEHRATAAKLDEVRRELSAAQARWANEWRGVHEELAATRTRLTLATNQLGGVRLQLDSEVRSRVELTAQNAALRRSAHEAHERDAESRARHAALEASRDQLRLLHATLASKMEVKSEQLAEAQAQLRDARADVEDMRPSQRGRGLADEAGLRGARGRLEGLRDAQAHLAHARARAQIVRDGQALSPRPAWEEAAQALAVAD